jgi:hypothetical protein
MVGETTSLAARREAPEFESNDGNGTGSPTCAEGYRRPCQDHIPGSNSVRGREDTGVRATIRKSMLLRYDRTGVQRFSLWPRRKFKALRRRLDRWAPTSGRGRPTALCYNVAWNHTGSKACIGHRFPQSWRNAAGRGDARWSLAAVHVRFPFRPRRSLAARQMALGGLACALSSAGG